MFARPHNAWADILHRRGSFKEQIRTESQDGRSMRVICRFTHCRYEIEIRCNSKGEISSVEFFTPDYAALSLGTPPYARTNSFNETEFKVVSGKWSLPGTLTVPTGDGPWPAIVLVHGTGDHDRDSQIAANRPFRDLAWGLASKGIAVLRYDKRTRVDSTLLTNATLTVREETIDDALAAAMQLRSAERIDAKRVFVAGHSLGGFAGPRIAQSDSRLAGLILLAGTPRHIEDVILEQTEYFLSLDGPMTADKQARLESVRACVSKIKSLTPAEAASGQMLFEWPAGYWLDLNTYDPIATARTLTLPMLVLQGGRDCQVTVVDFDQWKAGLAAKTNVAFKLYPDLNHLLIAGTGKPTLAEYGDPGHVDEGLIDDIAAWVEHLKR